MSLLGLLVATSLVASPPAVPSADDVEQPGEEPRIYGGDPVDPGAWPAVVAVEADKLCTGTLVAPNLVLTAAHCFNPDPVNAVKIVVGDTLTGGQVIPAQAWGRHPDFCPPPDCTEDLHDFAWIRLASDLSIEPIVPITVQTEYDEVMRVGAPTTFVGYGEDETHTTGIKREVVSSLTSFDDSGREFRAGGDGKDTCAGDSGGPAMVQLASGTWRLAGVISRGGDCGKGGIYGVPLPELCWLRDDSGVDLLPSGCESCDCVELRDDKGCGCRVSQMDIRDFAGVGIVLIGLFGFCRRRGSR